MTFEQEILKEMQREQNKPAVKPETKTADSGMKTVLIFGGIIALLMILGRKR